MASMFIDIVSEEAAEGPLAAFYQQQKAAWGFLPNFAAALDVLHGGPLEVPARRV